jgi:hypothetical protein
MPLLYSCPLSMQSYYYYYYYYYYLCLLVRRLIIFLRSVQFEK